MPFLFSFSLRTACYGGKNAKSFPGDLNVWWHEASLLVLLQWKGKKRNELGLVGFFFFFLFPKNKEDSEQAWSLLVFPLLRWPSDSKSWHTGKDPDARRRSKAKEKRAVDDELVRWQLVMDREAWHAVKNRTGLSDWTTNCNQCLNLLFCPLNLQKLWGCKIVWCILTSRYLVSLLPVSIIHVSDIFLVGFWS